MFKLHHVQKIMLSFMRLNNFFAIFADPGVGKTLPSLCRIFDLLKSGAIKNALIVAPKSALGAWERDLALFDDADRRQLENAITLVNYDKVWRGGEKSPYNKAYGCIILDESHCIKNRATRRTAFLLNLAVKSDYRYILTGTPIGNGRLEDIYSQYTFLDPELYRGRVRSRVFGSYKDFTDKYCVMNMYHRPASYIHVRELQHIINTYSYRVRKSECLDLPDKLPDEIIKVDLLEKKLYKKLVTESALLEYEILAENPLTRLLKLRQLSSGYIIDADGQTIVCKNDKPQILTEIIEGYPEDKKLVIFAEFKYSIRLIAETLKKIGITFVILDGDQKDKTIWRRFQADKSIRVIVCQYKTAAAGIDLFAADTIVYYEPTLSSTTLEQSRDRIHRRGQTSKCSYIHLLTRGTVEVDIYRTLAGYADFSEAVFTKYMESYRRSY